MEKGVTCQFNAPWPLSERTSILHGGKDNHKSALSQGNDMLCLKK